MIKLHLVPGTNWADVEIVLAEGLQHRSDLGEQRVVRADQGVEPTGLGIARRIGQVTRGELDVKPGSLFPALYRLEERGWLTSMPGVGGTHPRAKLYKLTQAGRKQIATETASWCRIAEAMTRVIEETS